MPDPCIAFNRMQAERRLKNKRDPRQGKQSRANTATPTMGVTSHGVGQVMPPTLTAYKEFMALKAAEQQLSRPFPTSTLTYTDRNKFERNTRTNRQFSLGLVETMLIAH